MYGESQHDQDVSGDLKVGLDNFTFNQCPDQSLKVLYRTKMLKYWRDQKSKPFGLSKVTHNWPRHSLVLKV